MLPALCFVNHIIGNIVLRKPLVLVGRQPPEPYCFRHAGEVQGRADRGAETFKWNGHMGAGY